MHSLLYRVESYSKQTLRTPHSKNIEKQILNEP